MDWHGIEVLTVDLVGEWKCRVKKCNRTVFFPKTKCYKCATGKKGTLGRSILNAAETV